MTTSGRSVQALNELKVELQAAMDALFALFGSIAIAVIGLLLLSVPFPLEIDQTSLKEVPGRVGQAIVCASSLFIVARAGQIPGILRRSLDLRHKISVDEARRKTLEAAPQMGELGAAFPTHADFGKSVALRDVRDPPIGPQ